MSVVRAAVALGILGLAGPARAQVACPAGMLVTEDTSGHCCWAGQAWSKTRATCVGTPIACPPGTAPSGETCAATCPPGQEANEETLGHCCWSGQVWSKVRQVCVGTPACPAGYTASGETCMYGTPLPGSAPGPGPQPPAPAPPSAAAVAPPGPTPGPSPIPSMGALEVPVDFAAEDERGDFVVSFQGPTGERSCRLPCTLNLPPGKVHLVVTGTKGFEQDLKIPLVTSSALLESPRRGTKIGLGVLLTVLGGACFVLGVGFYTPTEALFWLGAGVGAAGLAVGVVNIISGATSRHRLRLVDDDEKKRTMRREPTAPVELVGLGVAPTKGGLMAGATLRF